MLSSGISSSQISYGTPRQIAASTTSSGTVLYTVPTGKKFQGYIYNSGQGQSVGITPSGGSLVQIDLTCPSVGYASATAPLFTLVAGTIITTQSTGRTNVIGVETDA